MVETIRAFLDSCAVSFDLPILDWIQAHMQSAFLDCDHSGSLSVPPVSQ